MALDCAAKYINSYSKGPSADLYHRSVRHPFGYVGLFLRSPKNSPPDRDVQEPERDLRLIKITASQGQLNIRLPLIIMSGDDS